MRAKWMSDIPIGNMSYKRKVFERYGNFVEGTYSADTEFHWRLVQNGTMLRFVPAILVYHSYIDNAGTYLLHEYFHGESFARVRVKCKNFSQLKRWIYAILFPGIALKLFLKTVHSNLSNRVYLSQYLKTLPLLVLGIIFWSAGECVGYAGGKKGKP